MSILDILRPYGLVWTAQGVVGESNPDEVLGIFLDLLVEFELAGHCHIPPELVLVLCQERLERLDALREHSERAQP